MAKKSFLGAAGVAASFITTPQDIVSEENETMKEKKFNEIIKETQLEKPEMKKEPVKVEMKQEVKEEVVAPKKAVKVNDDLLTRATYSVDSNVAKQLKIKSISMDIEARDVITEALSNFSIKEDQVHPVEKNSAARKTYIMFKEDYDHLRKVAFNNDMNASDILHSALKKYLEI